MTMTYHAEVERKDRIDMIQTKIGFGQEIKRIYRNSVWKILSDTGVVTIMGENQAVITMYVCSRRELNEFFGGVKKIPKYLIKKVDMNQSLYMVTREGRKITA